MRIIIGLGNPGAEYSGTRHNIGFAIIDKLKALWEFPEFESNKKFDALVSRVATNKNDILLVKPETFMNLSGDAVKKILTFYKASLDDILVIHDDLDIALGKFKVATTSASAGHNGVQSIIETLGTKNFKRIRIGIGEVTEEGAIRCRLGAHDFVLGKFTPDEAKKIQELEPIILDEIKKLL